MALSANFFCDTCGAANRVQARFCVACGRALQTSGNVTISHTLTGLLGQQHLLKQRYRILAQLGKGGFGAVYKAADTQFGNRLLAIKEMSQSSLTQRELHEATESFKREALLLAGLTHPNLPRIYEQFHDGGRWYLVMDYIEGEALEVVLDTSGGKLAIERVLSIGMQLCAVLDYLHTRQPSIIFRDLKPANVMLTRDGHIFLIDFGIARHFKPGQAKDTAALGSSGYAAPEQYGKMQTTARADLYALGATLHQMITGNDPADAPFHFAPLQLMGHPALKALAVLVMQMVEVDISKRPTSADEVRQRLFTIASQYSGAATNPLQSSLPPGYHAVAGGSLGRGIAGAGTPLVANTMPPLASKAKASNVPQPQRNTLFICSGHSSRIMSLAWSPDGKRIATAGYDKTVRVWDVRNGKVVAAYRGHSDRVNAVVWSPNGQRIASASDDHTIHIWDAVSQIKQMTLQGHVNKVTALSWSSDSPRLASGGLDKIVQVWDSNSGRILFTYSGHKEAIQVVAWLPAASGRSARIASGSTDKTVQVWEPTKESKGNFFTSRLFPQRGTYSYTRHTQKVNALAWSPDGRRIASVGNDKTMQVWDVANGKLGFIHRNPASSLNAVAWSPDGRYLAAGGNDKMVQVWDANTRRLLCTYTGHTGYVMALAWSPDGKMMASAGVDHTLQVWRVW